MTSFNLLYFVGLKPDLFTRSFLIFGHKETPLELIPLSNGRGQNTSRVYKALVFLVRVMQVKINLDLLPYIYPKRKSIDMNSNEMPEVKIYINHEEVGVESKEHF